jgi:hypothetical protein
MTYDVRRLRLHGLIARVPRRHRYRITPTGAQVAMFYTRLYTRALQPAYSLQPVASARAQDAFERLDVALANFPVAGQQPISGWDQAQGGNLPRT